jgi:hypothetical protein
MEMRQNEDTRTPLDMDLGKSEFVPAMPNQELFHPNHSLWLATHCWLEMVYETYYFDAAQWVVGVGFCIDVGGRILFLSEDLYLVFLKFHVPFFFLNLILSW